MEWTAREKRLAIRRKWRSKIILEDEFGDGIVYLYSQDISLGGLFLKDPPPLKMGAHLFLSFLLPGRKRPLRLTGQVVRFIEYNEDGVTPAMRKGAGIRFVDIDPKTMKQLTEFIQKA